jgi:outer membrane protein TolC
MYVRDGRRLRPAVSVFAVLLLVLCLAPESFAQRSIDLTLERAVELAMDNSYRVRQLQLGIDQTRRQLRAERAGLRSRAYLDLSMPEIDVISEPKWDSQQQRDVIVRENTRRWLMNLTISQPVVLFGYPTNGYLSLNNRVYRYSQIGAEQDDIRFYNRYYIEYEQPLFQPNELRNDIEEAELNLSDAELNFQGDVANLVDDIADDYYNLFEVSYERIIRKTLVENLRQALAATQELAQEDPSRQIDLDQIQVELANAQEQVNQSESRFRMASSQIKQRLRLDPADAITIEPSLEIAPIEVDVDEAIELGRTLQPRLRRLEITRRERELEVESVRGNGGFEASLAVSYGRESNDPRFSDMFVEPSNSYSVGLQARVPIWDWGQRRERIQASEIRLRQMDLSIEEAELDIETSIRNGVENLSEYQSRALSMRENLERARTVSEQSLQRYREAAISASDLLQNFRRGMDTAENFLDAFLGYRQAILSLQQDTYYDFERGMPILDLFTLDGIGSE